MAAAAKARINPPFVSTAFPVDPLSKITRRLDAAEKALLAACDMRFWDAASCERFVVALNAWRAIVGLPTVK